MRIRAVVVAAGAAVLLLAACGPSQPDAARSPSSTPASASASTTAPAHQHTATPATPEPALRRGERFVTLRMPAAYTPKAPTTGTDDYRCFLLDPHLSANSVVTGLNVLPGNRAIVHHVILFRVPPQKVALAQQQDAAQPGQGWTCFGGTGVEGPGGSLDNAPWLGAWAPGGGASVLPADLGLPLAAGSRIIMQVHYNLLAGDSPDRSAARLRIAPDDGTRKTLETILLPAPVELPCRPGKTGPLCSRPAAVSDVVARFGVLAGNTGNFLNLVCPGNVPSNTQSCTRPVTEPATIRAVAGHMHLLGRSIRVTVNQGRPDQRAILDIPIWDFDNQASRPVTPAVRVKAGDTLTVTCTHDQSLRDQLPSFAGQPERYVVWGEGTTDEMCLGIVLVTRP